MSSICQNCLAHFVPFYLFVLALIVHIQSGGICFLEASELLPSLIYEKAVASVNCLSGR